MKLILDFDDTLSSNKKLKEYVFQCLREVGVPQNKGELYYKEIRSTGTPFSLRDFLSSVFIKENVKKVSVGDIYEKIMQICPDILNNELLDVVKKLGKDNCYMVTHGDSEYQGDKIKRSAIADLFKEVIITPGSKKEIISRICAENEDDTIFFVDNKAEFFKDLDIGNCKNLQTVLYDENGFGILKKEIEKLK